MMTFLMSTQLPDLTVMEYEVNMYLELCPSRIVVLDD